MASVRSTRIFRSGNGEAVRLPADWPVEVGDEVVMRRDGSRHPVEPVGPTISLAGIVGSLPWRFPVSDAERALLARALPWSPAADVDGDQTPRSS